MAACARTEPLEPRVAVQPGQPALSLTAAADASLSDDGQPITLLVAATVSPRAAGEGVVVVTASHGQFPTSGQASTSVTLSNGLAQVTFACDLRRDTACSGNAISFVARWDGLTANLVVSINHHPAPDAGTVRRPTLTLQAATGSGLKDDGSAIALTVVAAADTGVAGQGTVVLQASHGRFASGNQVELGLTGGSATTSYSCDAKVDPACNTPSIAFVATWAGLTAALEVPLTHVTAGTCDETCQQIAASLDGLQWDLPCGPAATSFSCFTTQTAPVSSTVGGRTGALYNASLRFRGVVEQRGYQGGSNDGAFWQIGGSPTGDQYNTLKFAISDPPQTYYVNRGTSLLQYCFLIDYTKSVQVATGATLTLSFQDTDGQEIDNIDSSGQPIRVPGLPGQPYNGQFVQIDVVSISEAN